MGQDYEYCKIDSLDDLGCPVDEYGHNLDPDASENGEARQLTTPYGSLEFAIGTGDDFYCFDYAMHPKGELVILHSVINSETGSFIQDGDYQVIPKSQAVSAALDMIEEALDWCSMNGVRHEIKGWNQDPYYFARSVAHYIGEGPVTRRIKSDWRKRPMYKGKPCNA
jgi:hypothetical protein